MDCIVQAEQFGSKFTPLCTTELVFNLFSCNVVPSFFVFFFFTCYVLRRWQPWNATTLCPIFYEVIHFSKPFFRIT